MTAISAHSPTSGPNFAISADSVRTWGQGKRVLTVAETSSPQFAQARTACAKYAPAGVGADETAPRSQAQIAETLALANCMRAHGVITRAIVARFVAGQ